MSEIGTSRISNEATNDTGASHSADVDTHTTFNDPHTFCWGWLRAHATTSLVVWQWTRWDRDKWTSKIYTAMLSDGTAHDMNEQEITEVLQQIYTDLSEGVVTLEG